MANVVRDCPCQVGCKDDELNRFNCPISEGSSHTSEFIPSQADYPQCGAHIPSSEGIVPEKLLAVKSMLVSLEHNPSSEGIVPVKLLDPKTMSANLSFMCSKENGRVPVNALPFMEIVTSSVSCPSSCGNEPNNKFNPTERTLRFVSSASSDGSDPFKLVKRKRSIGISPWSLPLVLLS